MASAGLLGALAGLGKGIQASGEMLWKEAVQKDRDERLAEIERNNADYKAKLELEGYKEKKAIDAANPDPKDRFVSVGSGGLYDAKTGKVVAAGSSTGLLKGGYKATKDITKDAFGYVKTMIGGDKVFANLSEDAKEAKMGEVASLATFTYLNDDQVTDLGSAVDRAYKQIYGTQESDKTSDKKTDAPTVKSGSYDPPGLDLWGTRDSADSSEIVTDLENKITAGKLKTDQVASYIDGTVSPNLSAQVQSHLKIRADARAELAQGRTRSAVIARLKEIGVPTDGL